MSLLPDSIPTQYGDITTWNNRDGYLHRLDGPAIESRTRPALNGWFIQGVEVNKENHKLLAFVYKDKVDT